jgi:acyl-CoA reductase-like NAD-dependent aldehyde dehydrogenase
MNAIVTTDASTIGARVDGLPSDGTGRRLVVTDPADDSLVTDVACAASDDVAAAVEVARHRAREWARTSPAGRAAAVSIAAARVQAKAEELAHLVTREMGKPLADSRGGVEAAVALLRQYAEFGPLHRGRSLAGERGTTDLMVHEPRGVVAAITPWNDPVAVSCGLIGAALVTGNTVVYKPSERTPGTGRLLADILNGVLPEGVLNLLLGGGDVGAALAEQPVDVVAHVGSTKTGRAIARAGAQTGARVLLENGGSDPLIVDDNIDPEWAGEQAALGAFANAGQICVAVERIYVLSGVADAFVTSLTHRAAALRVGPGLDPTTQLGPLVDRRLRGEVHTQVCEAVGAGATALCGGQVPDGPGSFYPATVLIGCTDEMTVMREETFGPVAPVMVVESFDEALDRAAQSPYGLAATVLTSSMTHAQRAWRTLDVGTVKINDVFGGAPGGAAHPRRGSGQGYGYGPELLDELTATKVVHIAAHEA